MNELRLPITDTNRPLSQCRLVESSRPSDVRDHAPRVFTRRRHASVFAAIRMLRRHFSGTLEFIF